MKRCLLILLSFQFLAGITVAQIINPVALSDRVTGYKIDAVLDPSTKIVSGKMEAYWVNISDNEVVDIMMHLYMNAFKSGNTTMYKELGSLPGQKRENLGWIEILSFTGEDGLDLMPNISFISPDDGNPNDSTVLRVLLPAPARPGDTVKIYVDFDTKLPLCTRRTGFNEDFFFVAQWFPKFGVYEPAGMRYSDGAWNCHQFHANSEFYSNHSLYEVNITAPSEYVVGSCGLLLSETDDGSSKTGRWRAEDIVDFAWTAWPGYEVYSDKWNHVNISLLIPAKRSKQVERQFNAVKNGLEFFTENVGRYPWPYITVVDPPTKGQASGGMEYTTLFTSQSFDFMPDYFYLPETVTVHEFGHAYFMGILATNEFEEPWMDEGMNTFFEHRIMDHYWGEQTSMINHPVFGISDKMTGRIAYVASPSKSFVSNNEYSWNYPNETYSIMSYMKASLWLYSLMGIVGEDTMNNIFREYYNRWAFKHPCATDFIDVVNDVVSKDHGDKFGENMDWFFGQTLYGTGVCDYEVVDIRNVKSVLNPGRIESTIFLSNKGDLCLPVEVLVGFDDGTEVVEQWNGKGEYKELTFSGEKKVEWTKIDPDYKNRLDIDFINNSMSLKRDKIPIRRITDKIMMVIQFFLFAF
ncbi:MAG: M1 family metallopeptidase [Bacteroidales bacterium]|jgi:hypothetical protein